jgi:hypothetical protein
MNALPFDQQVTVAKRADTSALSSAQLASIAIRSCASRPAWAALAITVGASHVHLPAEASRHPWRFDFHENKSGTKLGIVKLRARRPRRVRGLSRLPRSSQGLIFRRLHDPHDRFPRRRRPSLRRGFRTFGLSRKKKALRPTIRIAVPFYSLRGASRMGVPVQEGARGNAPDVFTC